MLPLSDMTATPYSFAPAEEHKETGTSQQDQVADSDWQYDYYKDIRGDQKAKALFQNLLSLAKRFNQSIPEVMQNNLDIQVFQELDEQASKSHETSTRCRDVWNGFKLIENKHCTPKLSALHAIAYNTNKFTLKLISESLTTPTVNGWGCSRFVYKCRHTGTDSKTSPKIYIVVLRAGLGIEERTHHCKKALKQLSDRLKSGHIIIFKDRNVFNPKGEVHENNLFVENGFNEFTSKKEVSLGIKLLDKGSSQVIYHKELQPHKRSRANAFCKDSQPESI